MIKQGVRQRIIETASRLFYFQGFNQTGINQIIKEASVAKASLYQHFRSKEDIAVAYLQERHITWMDNLEEYVSKTKPKEGQVVGCFDYLIEWLENVDFRGCAWQNIIADLPKAHHKIQDQAVLHKNDFQKYIHKLLKSENIYSDAIAENLGDEILILIEGAIILSQIQKNKWPITIAKKACIKLITI